METNLEKLTRFMKYSQAGPLMQAFIMSAVQEAADRVAEYYHKHPEDLDAPCIVNQHAWLACAEELLRDWNKEEKS